jgi:phosphohistidine phosphatase
MKNLILIRHAKSSWETSLNDVDRPLTIEGVKDAHLVSMHISSCISKTFLVWSSTAKRASDTAIIFAQNISYPVESILFSKKLYTFDANQLEKEIKSCSDSFDNLIVFGHNDAITNFVNSFGSVYINNVSTSGFVSLQFDTNNWNNINKGETKKIVFPKDLK